MKETQGGVKGGFEGEVKSDLASADDSSVAASSHQPCISVTVI